MAIALTEQLHTGLNTLVVVVHEGLMTTYGINSKNELWVSTKTSFNAQWTDKMKVIDAYDAHNNARRAIKRIIKAAEKP